MWRSEKRWEKKKEKKKKKTCDFAVDSTDNDRPANGKMELRQENTSQQDGWFESQVVHWILDRCFQLASGRRAGYVPEGLRKKAQVHL